MFKLSDETVKALIQWSLAKSPPSGAHITRFSMYRALQGCLAEHDGEAKTALAISHSAQFGRGVLGLARTRFTEANFPEHDMASLGFETGSFDFCVSDQVLEHVEGDPFVAFAESARVVRSGGFVCHTTCFINEVHEVPKDFWRFTPRALTLLAERSGCRTVTAAGWGNVEAWALIQAGFRFAPIPTDPGHPLHIIATRNDPAWPIVVWVVARKP